MKNILIVFLLVLFGLVNTMNSQNCKVIITAHRGASGYAPENTLASMKEAINMKADFGELDVQETLDGEIVLLHDDELKRTTGSLKNIWEMNYEEVKTLDAGSWFSEKFKGEPLPKLSDVIDSVRGKLKLNIELKNNGHEKKLEERTIKVVKDKNFSGQCIFTSFDYPKIIKVKEIDPTLKVGLIFKRMPDSINVFTANMELLSVHFSLVDSEFMKKAKENGKEVHVWTVNEENEMKRLIGLGVTSIITNYPDKLKKILDETK
jgi:glycerophosphoryl diester phosphodiesterase